MFSSGMIAVEDREYNIGELSNTFDVSLRTIRYYEQIGLIAPRKRTPIHRVFTREDVERLDFIIGCRALGLAVKSVQELILLRDRNEYGAFLNLLRNELAARQHEITQEIEDLHKQDSGVEKWLELIAAADTSVSSHAVGQ